MPTSRHVSVRLTPAGYERLQALAEGRGVSRSRAIRQLVDEAAPDAPPKPRRHLSEDDLLDLLTERAADGNVTAIRALLEMERQRDPRQSALEALEVMAEARRQ